MTVLDVPNYTHKAVLLYCLWNWWCFKLFSPISKAIQAIFDRNWSQFLLTDIFFMGELATQLFLHAKGFLTELHLYCEFTFYSWQQRNICIRFSVFQVHFHGQIYHIYVLFLNSREPKLEHQHLWPLHVEVLTVKLRINLCPPTVTM